jgi:Mo-dependent nitrogenase C-terminus
MNLSQHTNQDLHLNNWMLGEKVNFDIFQALRQRLDRVQVSSPKLAHRLCQLIPAQCPFERDITVFGRTFHIPPMCKLNPLYDEVVALRFRALCFLADECGEDVTAYC